MTTNHIERFMTTSEKYLHGPDERVHDERTPRAARLLVKEFREAVAKGPDTLLSTPETMREAQLTLSAIVDRLLDVHPHLLDDLLVEISGGTKDDVINLLANTYARWVVASYDGSL